MNQTSITLIGNGSAAVRVFRVLREMGVGVPLVIADARDTGEDTWRLSLVGEAGRAGYRAGEALLSPKDPNAPEVLEAIRSADADAILSVQCARILRRPILQLARRGVINLHNAPLPLLRGCDPFSWAIHDGLLEMGVSLHQISDEGIDNGPVLAQRRWPVGEDTTAWDLYLRALDEAAEIVRESIVPLLAGELTPVPQNPGQVTYHPMGQFDFSDLEVGWDRGAAALSAWIRSRIFPPFQLPYFMLNGRRVEIVRCRRCEGRGEPGTVLSENPLRIAARRGGIEVLEEGGEEGFRCRVSGVRADR